MTKTTISNIQPDQQVVAGYKRSSREFFSLNAFVCFRAAEQKFYSLAQLKDYFGVRNLRDLEFENDRIGYESVKAEFKDLDEDFTWSAYLFNGGFKVGSSADALKFAN